jgi:hypothetical protein
MLKINLLIGHTLINFDDIEIINQYNAELRGLMYYYRYAVNCKAIIGRVQWLSTVLNV